MPSETHTNMQAQISEHVIKSQEKSFSSKFNGMLSHFQHESETDATFKAKDPK